MTTSSNEWRTTLALLVAVSLLLVRANGASAQTWQLDFDASLSTLPSAQGFTHNVFDPLPDDGLDEGNYLVALGALVQGETGGPNSDAANTQWYQASPPAFDFDEGLIVFDLSLQILSSTLTAPGQPTPSAGFGVVVLDEQGESVTLFVGSAGLFIHGAGGAGGSSLLAAFDSTLAYADYQLRIDEYGASIRVDGVLLATLDRDEFATGGGSSASYLGDVSGSELGSSQLQSFRLSRFVPPVAQVHNYETITEYSATDSTSTKSRTVNCPSGKQALGGGAETIGADGSVGLTDSGPTGGPPATSWFAAARELVDTGDSWQIRVDVICGEVSGYQNLSFAEPHSTDAFQSSELDCASTEKVVIGGGVGFSGADLRQTLTRSIPFLPIAPLPLAWGVGVKDYGAATSSSAWGVEIDAICSDAFKLESDGLGVLDSVSPKQATINCTSGKVPIGGGAQISGFAGNEPALRASRPKDGSPGDPPVGWFAEGQVDPTPTWQLDVEVLCAPIADPTVSKTGLMGRWKGEDAGFDSWSLGHGTLENGVGFAPGILGQGQSFSFDGVSEQWVKIPSDLPGSTSSATTLYDLYPEASFTVEAWLQTTTVPSTAAYIVMLYDYGGLNPLGTNASTWAIMLDDQARPVGQYRDSTPPDPLTNVGPGPADSLADGQPHHVALIRDSEARLAYLYVDGVLEVADTITLGINEGPLEPGNVLAPDPVSIGIVRVASSTSFDFQFTGLIDDVKFYDRALSREEIQNTAGCSLDLSPRVLNLDASLFGSPAGEGHTLCVFLKAGQYDATLVTPALDPDARLTAWAPSATSSWSTVYVIEPEIDAGTVGGFPTSSSTPQQAFDATTIKTASFTLSVDQRVHFSVVDDEVLDNRGGVSVKVVYVPEPSLLLSMTSGVALLGLMTRWRSRRTDA